MINNVGARLRHIRKSKGLTLSEVAQRTNMSIGFLSNLERDISSPTLDSLWHICEALDISLIKLLETSDGNGRLIRADEREIILKHNNSAKYETINFGDDKMEGILITLEPKCEYARPWKHSYEELGLVLEGELTILFEEEEYLLHEGDAFYVEAKKMHSLSNHADIPCVSYWVKRNPGNSEDTSL